MTNSIVSNLKIIVKSNVFILACMVGIGLLVYFPAISGDFFGDDGGQIVTNPYIRSLSHIPTLFQGGTFYTGGSLDKPEGTYYRPLMAVSYTLLYAVFGLDYRFFHIFQIVLHGINAYLMHLLFYRLLRVRAVAVGMALIFLVHPINVEAVAYLADLQDVLFVFFGLLGLYVMIKGRSTIRSQIGAFFLIFLSLLSKEIGVVFILMGYLFLDLFTTRKKRLFVGGSVAVVAFYIFLRCGIAHICMVPSNVPIASLSSLERIVHFPLIIFTYLKTFFYPKDLAIFQYWLIDHINWQSVYLPLAAVLIFFGSLLSVPFVLYAKRKDISKETLSRWLTPSTPLARVYVFFFLWFLVGLAAHLHIIPLDATVAERWFYFPIIGLLGILGVIIILLRLKRRLFFVVIIIVIFPLAVRSFVRSQDWADAPRLYARDIQISKNSSTLENNYGVHLYEQKNYDQAFKHFSRAVELAPHNPIYLYNLAVIYMHRNDKEKTEYYLRESIRQGRYYLAFEEYARFLINEGRTSEAQEFLKTEALKHFPHNKTIHDLYNKVH